MLKADSHAPGTTWLAKSVFGLQSLEMCMSGAVALPRMRIRSVSGPTTTGETQTFVSFATPLALPSACCAAVLTQVQHVPHMIVIDVESFHAW